MENIEKNIEYISQYMRDGGKMALCCILYGNNEKETERLYYVNCRLPLQVVKHEIELWKSYVQHNSRFRDMMINDFVKFQNRVGEING